MENVFPIICSSRFSRFASRSSVGWTFFLLFCLHVSIAYRMGFDLSLPNYLTSFSLSSRFKSLFLLYVWSPRASLVIAIWCFFLAFRFLPRTSCCRFFHLPSLSFDPRLVALFKNRFMPRFFHSVDCLFAVYFTNGTLIDTYACAALFLASRAKTRERELNISPKKNEKNVWATIDVRFFSRSFYLKCQCFRQPSDNSSRGRTCDTLVELEKRAEYLKKTIS